MLCQALQNPTTCAPAIWTQALDFLESSALPLMTIVCAYGGTKGRTNSANVVEYNAVLLLASWCGSHRVWLHIRLKVEGHIWGSLMTQSYASHIHIPTCPHVWGCQSLMTWDQQCTYCQLYCLFDLMGYSQMTLYCVLVHYIFTTQSGWFCFSTAATGTICSLSICFMRT